MTAFTRTWNSTYMAIPENDDDALEGAAHIRNTRTDVKERMEVDHHWAGDGHDGKHKKLTFRPEANDPTLEADEVSLYAKAVGTKTELFFKNEDGNVIQMTFSGQSQTLPAGMVLAYAGDVAPGGYVFCFGQALSRTTYAALFSAIGTAFGAGDGSTTFNVPDIRGRVPAGKDDMGGAAAGRLSARITGTTRGAVGGVEQHTLLLAEVPAHSHTITITDPGHTHTYSAPQGGNGAFGGGSGVTPSTTGSSTTGITASANSQGGGGSHTNLQPTIILNYLIKT